MPHQTDNNFFIEALDFILNVTERVTAYIIDAVLNRDFLSLKMPRR
jgi:hypothetical protein